jgi:hypothetical protein
MQNFGMTQRGINTDPSTFVDTNGDKIPDTPTQQLDGTAITQADYMQNYQDYMTQDTKNLQPSALMANAPTFQNFGDMELLTVMFKADGIGDGISDYLDDTKFFASWAQSKTKPKAGMNMLGSPDSETGTSTWVGLNMPCLLTKNGRIGIEYNQGSKYWRSVTYGEDTMTGSKIAARGNATEIYYTKPINNALSFNLRYTKINYDYTGSNSFFGEDGAPVKISTINETNAMQYGDPVKESSDFRASINYRF